MTPLVIVVVVAAFVAMVVLLRRRGGSPSPLTLDPFAVGEPWRQLVSSAQRSQRRYRQVVDTAAAGPTRDRLGEIAGRLDQAVVECFHVARRGYRLDQTASDMRIEVTRDDLARLEAAGSLELTAAQTQDSLRTRIATYERIIAGSRNAEAKLRLLDARLQETAARGAELALGSSAEDIDGLGLEVTSVTGELEALRQAVEEVDGRPGSTAS